MEKKSIKKNFIYNLSVQIITILAPLITAPYVSRVLTVEGVGRYSLTFANVSYFVLFATLGTSVYAQREIAAAQGSREKISRVFTEVFLLRVLLVLLSLAAYYVLFRETGSSHLVLIQGINIIGVAFDISWLFQGLEEFKRVALRTLFVKLGFIAFIFIFIKNESHVELYAFGYALMLLLANMALWVYVPRLIKWTRPDFKTMFKRLWPAFLLFIPTIATQVYTVLDKTMLGIFTDTDVENGLYESAEKISRIALTVYTAYGTVLSPRITSLLAAGKREEAGGFLSDSLKIMWGMVLPMLAGMFAISSNLIPWFYGEGYEGSIELLKIFAFLLIPVGLSNVLAVQYLVPARKQNVFTVSVVAGAVFNCCLNLLLIPGLYAVGAALASVLAETLITLIQFIYVVFIEKSFSLRQIFGPLPKYLIMTLIMFVPVYYLSEHLSAGLVNTLIIGGTGIFIYGLELIITKDRLIRTIGKK